MFLLSALSGFASSIFKMFFHARYLVLLATWWINHFIFVKCLSLSLVSYVPFPEFDFGISIFNSALICLVFVWYSFFFFISIFPLLTYYVFEFKEHFPFHNEYSVMLFSNIWKQLFHKCVQFSICLHWSACLVHYSVLAEFLPYIFILW